MDRNQKTPKLNLSFEQKQAIQDISGATLLLAVPGSGKTTTLVSRIGHMIYDCGISPESILVITFTKAAATDMRKRFAKLYGKKYADIIDFRTINSLCYQIVLWYAKVSGHTKPIDDTDSEANINKLFRNVYEGAFPSENQVRDLAQEITFIKNMGLTNEEISKRKLNDEGLLVKPMYDAYTRYLKRKNAMDFDDQIVFAHKIMKNNLHGMRDSFSERFPYVLVDEAQDTSKLQHDVIRYLTMKHGNLFMVGDEDQSIYGFRAAYPDALMRFREEYQGGRVLYLQTNYRSTQSIVRAANRVIANNKKRYKKDMYASSSKEGLVRICNVPDRLDQYSVIISMLRTSLNNEETAIIYRNNDSALPWISIFMREGIKYRSKGLDPLFFSHNIVKDAMKFLDLAMDPSSHTIFLDSYYKLGLYFKKDDVERALRSADHRNQQPLFMAILDVCCKYDSQRKRVVDLMAQFNLIRKNNNVRDAIHRIRTCMNYKNGMNEKLLILESIAYPEETISDFQIRFRNLQETVTRDVDDPEANIILSTVHGSKGLEYDNVIMIDAIDGILPSPENDEEEERRIFYVGITRAKERLFIYKYGGYGSPFIDEIQCLETSKKEELKNHKATFVPDRNLRQKKNGPANNMNRASRKEFGKKDEEDQKTAIELDRLIKEAKQSSRNGINKEQELKRLNLVPLKAESEIKKGMIVKHDQYGFGKVVSVYGDIAEIRYGNIGIRRTTLSLACKVGYLRIAK